MNRFFLTIFILLLSFNLHAEKIIIESDKLTTIDNNTAIAEGAVLILYNDMVITTDKATYNKSEGFLELEGDIVFKDNTNLIRADYAKVYMDNKTGFFRKGKGFYAPWSYFSADRMEKIGENSFILDNATISTCSGEKPDWSFSSSKAKIDLGEYFHSKHSFGNIKDTPVIYFPYFVWPIKKERQSGFLVPSFGFSSSKGFFITPKYFWAIDIDKDMTTGLNLFSNNGVMLLNEFRYAISKNENLHLIGEFIDDRDSESDKTSRWRLYGVGNIAILKNLDFKFHVDYVSDFKYKRDFSDYNMIDNLKHANKDKNEFVAELRLGYYTDFADLSLMYKDSMQFYDNSDGYTKNNVYQKPGLQAEKYGLNVKDFFKIDYLLDYNRVEKKIFKYRYNDNDQTDTYSYERYNAKLKFYKPFDLKIATFTPFYTQYYTSWFNTNYTLENFRSDEKSYLNIDVKDNDATRAIYSLGYSIMLNEVYRDYENFRHSIYNTFEYIQTPYLNQSSLPNNIAFDRISEANLYRYNMTNYLKSKYWDLKLELIQGYDLTLEEERFTPFHSKLNITYLKMLTLGLESKYNLYKDRIEYYKNNIGLNFSNYYLDFSQSYDKTISDTDNSIMGLKFGGKFEKLNFEIYKKIGQKLNQ
ncbi:MAG: hypothetical protein LDL13_03295, partial [Calditerrivibrio sp.]|nr:hypothetical protein [Calditerrivibrio sp.]